MIIEAGIQFANPFQPFVRSESARGKRSGKKSHEVLWTNGERWTPTMHGQGQVSLSL